MIDRAEMRLHREVLLELGQEPDLLIHPNVVGEGFYGAVLPQLAKALCRSCARTAERVLFRNRVTYGLGGGSPDFVGAIAGRGFGLELKTDTGRLSGAQLEWHERARARGLLVGVARSPEGARELIERWRAGG